MTGMDAAHPPVLGSRALALVQRQPWTLVVGVAMAFWWVLLFAETRSDYLSYRLARFDLGNMVQAVWSTAHGRPLEMTLGSGEQAERLASHVDPILVLLTPLWLAFPSPLTLVAIQIAAVALGALPVFWLARRHLGSDSAAGLLALAYLAYPWIAWTALDAMHPVTLAIPLFLYAIWFLDTDRTLAVRSLRRARRVDRRADGRRCRRARALVLACAGPSHRGRRDRCYRLRLDRRLPQSSSSRPSTARVARSTPTTATSGARPEAS